MQIVIDIPEEMYDALCMKGVFVLESQLPSFLKVLRNGTVLPSGHGRLVDVKEILDAYKYDYKGEHADDLSAFLSDYVQTVVPPDKDGD